MCHLAFFVWRIQTMSQESKQCGGTGASESSTEGGRCPLLSHVICWHGAQPTYQLACISDDVIQRFQQGGAGACAWQCPYAHAILKYWV
jgi:hypothetical protein